MEIQQPKARGRQKIPIAHIIDKNKRHATFSKRRTGLFKKAAELSILTGCSIAILTFTGVGTAFSFGSPDVDAIVQRYLNDLRSTRGKNNNVPAASQYFYDHDDDDYPSTIHNYNKEYQDLIKKQVVKPEPEEEKHMSGDDNMYRSNGGDDGETTESLFWWEVDENLGLDELEEYMVCLEQLKTNVAMKADQLALMNFD